MIPFVFDLPRWAFFLLLIVTPWAWGGIPIWIEVVWYKVCLIISVGYLISGLARRKLTLPPVVPTLAAVGILAQGWWMVYNAHFQPMSHLHRIFALVQPYPDWAGSFNRIDSYRLMWKVTALFSVICITGRYIERLCGGN